MNDWYVYDESLHQITDTCFLTGNIKPIKFTFRDLREPTKNLQVNELRVNLR